MQSLHISSRMIYGDPNLLLNKVVNRLIHFFGKIHFLLMSENEFFPEINVTELRDGITSLHGIHAGAYLGGGGIAQ